MLTAFITYLDSAFELVDVDNDGDLDIFHGNGVNASTPKTGWVMDLASM